MNNSLIVYIVSIIATVILFISANTSCDNSHSHGVNLSEISNTDLQPGQQMLCTSDDNTPITTTYYRASSDLQDYIKVLWPLTHNEYKITLIHKGQCYTK